jgi:hypothetical protein
MNHYTNQVYAAGRLEGTVVNTVDGEPVYIENVKEDEYVIRSLSLLQLKRVKPNQIDLTPVKLGWCNVDGTAYYLSRVPVRKWKQGLHPENIAVDGVHKFGASLPFELVSLGLHNTIKGVYPSYQGLVKNGVPHKKAAFHRSWAMDYNKSLWYKGRIVGSIVGGIPHFNASESYLRGDFERQVGVNCAYP